MTQCRGGPCSKQANAILCLAVRPFKPGVGDDEPCADGLLAEQTQNKTNLKESNG